MSSDQLLARFNPSSSLDFYKCLKLAKKIAREKQATNSEKISKQKIQNFKRKMDISEYEDFANPTLAEAENYARELGFRLRVWKQKTYKHKLILEFEGNPAQDGSESLQNLDLFSLRFEIKLISDKSSKSFD